MINTGNYTLKEDEVCPDPPRLLINKPIKSENQQCDFSVKIHRMNTKDMEVDLIGLHFSLVNGYRRIVLAEVPTMAIEKVYMYKNTSIVQDEVLSHRLGLVPLNVPPHFFSFQQTATFNSDNSVMYRLKVKCRGKEDSRVTKPTDEDGDDVKSVDRLVTAADLQWLPFEEQLTMFKDSPLLPIKEEIKLPDGVTASNSDLVLCKLNPGQKIILDAYALKGIGSDHAKFQPGLCWYRMMPQLTLHRPVLNEEAHKLQKYFTPGVVGIRKNKNGVEEAFVDDPRYDSGSRNVYQDENLKDAVTIGRDAEHIIFNIESHSAMKSYEILEAAVQIMIDKCDIMLNSLLQTEEESG